jgi:hypothetical protein
MELALVKRRRLSKPVTALSAHAPAPTGDADAFFAAYAAQPPEGQAVFRKVLVVGEFEMWRTCPIEACRRAGACRGPEIDCFDDRRAELKQAILATFARWIDIAEITPEEFELYWEREARAAGLDVEGGAMV